VTAKAAYETKKDNLETRYSPVDLHFITEY